MPIVAFFPLRFFSEIYFLLQLLCVPSLLLSEALELLDGDLLCFDGACLAFCKPCPSFTLGMYSLCLILAFSVCWCCWFVWASVVCDWVS